MLFGAEDQASAWVPTRATIKSPFPGLPSPGFVRPDDPGGTSGRRSLSPLRAAPSPGDQQNAPRGQGQPGPAGRPIRSPSTTRASSTVTPGYSEVSTTARPNSPARVAST